MSQSASNVTLADLWPELMSDIGITGPIAESPASLLSLLPESLTGKGWIAVLFMSLLNKLLNRVASSRKKDAEQRARAERRRRRLGVWEERQHSGLEKLHEMLVDMDIPEVDLNTVDMHEWLDYTFWRL
ncbi:hypothetical protein CPLU01_15529 [Colletotrichum plurivorum]|uniref:Uncharacterized protein n=1 Tax=Colletotrichum plurivorum TaxID=2175906 RepID=A0A8H6MV13_9PEZI|nr:hypothetical protein CPLU01_15529 [Colletotrichum plurivorum]